MPVDRMPLNTKTDVPPGARLSNMKMGAIYLTTILATSYDQPYDLVGNISLRLPQPVPDSPRTARSHTSRNVYENQPKDLQPK